MCVDDTTPAVRLAKSPRTSKHINGASSTTLQANQLCMMLCYVPRNKHMCWTTIKALLSAGVRYACPRPHANPVFDSTTHTQEARGGTLRGTQWQVFTMCILLVVLATCLQRHQTRDGLTSASKVPTLRPPAYYQPSLQG